MGLSKVYRGYVIEDVNGQWYIRNAPTWTSMNAFSPGPHGGWTVATHQVDKLIDFMNREAERDRGQWQPSENHSVRSPSYTSSSSVETKDWEDMGFFEKIVTAIVAMILIAAGIFLVLIIMASKW